MAPRPSEESKYAKELLTISVIVGSVQIVVLLLYLRRLLRSCRSRAGRKRIAESLRAPEITENGRLSTSPTEFAASIAVPEKSLTRELSSHGFSDKVVVSSTPESTPSTLFFCRPLSNASFAPPRPRAMSILNPAWSRHSRSSSGFTAYASYSFPPGLDSRRSSAISTSSAQAGPVRQLFEPVLSDELALARLGEYLSVLRSYDDGWSFVTRDSSRRTSHISTMTPNNGDNVDSGFVPTWVFVKPLKGVTFARPFRFDSMNPRYLTPNPNLPSGREQSFFSPISHGQ